MSDLWRGIFAAAAVFCILALVHALALPPFAAIDEAANAGYALALADGELPTLDTEIPRERIPGLWQRMVLNDRVGAPTWIWTANHPPLFYLLLAIPIGGGQLLGLPLFGLWLGRLLNIAFGGALVVATGWLTTQLVPGRPRAALWASGWVAVIPLLSAMPAALYSDYFAHAMGTACLVLGLRAMGEPAAPDRTRLFVSAAVAAVSRVSGLVFVGLSSAYVTAGALVHRRPGWRRPAGTIGGMLLAAIAVAGPFFVRNHGLYGELSGTGYNIDKLARKPGRSLFDLLTAPEFYLDQALQLLGKSIRSDALWASPAVEISLPIRAVAMVALFALPLLGILRVVLRGSLAGRPRAFWLRWAVALLLPVAAVAMTALHTSRGGYEHARYLFMGLPSMAAAAGAGLLALPRPARWTSLGVALGLITAVNLPGFAQAHFGDPDAVTMATAFLPTAFLTGPWLPLLALVGVTGPIWVFLGSLRRCAPDPGAAGGAR